MKRLLVLVLFVVLTIGLVSCNEKQSEPPIDLSEHVTVELVGGNLIFDTSNAEKELGRSFEFYTHKKMSASVISFLFYDKNATVIGYANVTIQERINKSE